MAQTVADLDQTLAGLRDAGVNTVRMNFADLHGIQRGKDFPLAHLAHLAEHGAAFCEAIMTVDLRHNVVAGFEHGFQDIMARPDASTLVQLPWAPTVAACLADLETLDGQPYGADSRGVLRRAVAAFDDLGYAPIVGPELEFYLCQADPTAPNGYRRYVANDSHVYTVGPLADPKGVLLRMLHACADLGLGAFAANHEFGRSQFEINLRHSEAVDASDRAFRLKAAVKEIAAMEGLLATFIGKPWNDDEGSGFHLHVSLNDADGRNALNDDDGPEGLSEVSHQFTAGVMEHAPALMAFFNPTVNAYRRINPEALVPTLACWGHDNRFALVRVPRERGRSTRLEVRVGDGSANVYLATAATLFAGLDGIRRGLSAPEPVEGLIYELPAERLGAPLPTTFEAAIEALGADDVLREAMGAKLVDTFLTIKGAELDRYRRWVSDWEFREYVHHL
jgi:glutamine synthetase